MYGVLSGARVYGQDRKEGVIPIFEDNLHQLKTKVETMIAVGQAPMVFLDLDDTLNRRFGTSIEDKAVTFGPCLPWRYLNI